MSKEAYLAAHEALVEQYLDDHPEATWEQAYEACADAAYERMISDFADRCDEARDRLKYGE